MAGVNTYLNQLTSPTWAGDFLDREHLMPGGAKVDASQFMATDGAAVTLTANALVNAVSIAVSALANPIPSGTLLRFGAGKYAYTTANAAAGAVTIAVEALPVALTKALADKVMIAPSVAKNGLASTLAPPGIKCSRSKKSPAQIGLVS